MQAANLNNLGYWLCTVHCVRHQSGSEPTAEVLAAYSHRDAEGANRGGAVFHDDGTVRDEAPEEHVMYQRRSDNDALGYQASVQTGSTAAADPAEALQQQIATPSTAAISDHDQSTLDGAVAQAASAGAESEAPAGAAGVQSVTIPHISDPPASESTVVPEAAVSNSGPVASSSGAAEQQNGAAAPSESKDAGIETQDASASATVDQQQPPSDAAQPSELTAAQSAASKDTSAATASVEHVIQPGGTASTYAIVADETAKEVKPSTASGPAGNSTAEAQSGKHRVEVSQNGQATAETSKVDVDMPDSSKDTALNAAATDAAASGQTTAQPSTNAAAPKESSPAQGERWKGPSKGPGLGNSREFSGGPMYAERPKFRHAPYGTPPMRPGGRFSFDGGRFPGGRNSPTGRALGRRGPFNEPPRQVKNSAAIQGLLGV